jgi:hypothetical protein
MPWMDEESTATGLRGLSPDKPKPPGFTDVIGDAFQTGNPVGSFLATPAEARPVLDPYTFYDPFNAIPDHIPEDYYKAYAFANNDEDVAAITRNIERQIESRQRLAEAGWLGVAADLTAGVLDPINLLPVGGAAVSSYKVGASILKGGLATMRAGVIGATAAELALHSTQEVRTWGESAVNVTGAALLSGVLGGAVSGLATTYGKASVGRRFADMASKLEKDMEVPAPGKYDPMEPGTLPDVQLQTANPEGGSLSAAQADAFTDAAQERLSSALGVEKIVAAQDPMLRTVTSPNFSTRKTSQLIAENPLQFVKNEEGIPSPIAVETRVKMWDAPLAQGFEGLDDAFVRYRMGRSQRFGDRARIGMRDTVHRSDMMSKTEFDEQVARAMRRRDQHEVPEVAAAAAHLRKTVYDPLKNLAIKAGLLPKDVDVTTAASYLSRVYNIEKMVARKDGFIQVTANWLRTQDADALDEEIQDLAERIWGRIVGTPDGRLPYDTDLGDLKPRSGSGSATARGPMKARTFDIPDELIEDFLDHDIESITRRYVRTMAADSEIALQFGDVQMTKAIDEIEMEWQRAINAAPEKDRAKLDKKRKADIRDIAAMRDRIRGTYGAPKDPNAIVVRTFRAARNINYLNKLGGMTLSAIPDAARVVMTHGVLRTFGDGFIPMIRNFKAYRLASKEVKLAGTALDMVLNTRANALAELADDFGRHTTVERGIKALTDRFGLISLMSPWNAMMKQFAGVVTMSRMLDACDAAAAGKISKKESTKLMQQTIGIPMAKRIAEQFDEWGETLDGVKMANTEAWTDRAAAEAFRAGLVKEVDRIIVTPGQDKPLWMSNELGRTIGQFRSFSFASTQRVLLSGLQQRDAGTLNGTVAMIGLGAMSYALKEQLAGRDLSDNPAVWVAEGIDRSGITGWLFEANNMLEKVTRNQVGVSQLVGDPVASRYVSRNVTGAVLGPTLGLAQDILQVTGSVAAGDYTAQDTRAFRRVIPLQNTFYLRGLFDLAEEGVNDALGVPNTRN